MKRKNGEGSWGTKTINGFSYYYYRNSEGKYYYATTMKELKAKIKKATTTISAKTNTLKAYGMTWLQNVKALELEPRTYDEYENIIEKRIGKHSIGNRQLASITSDTWQAYINELAGKYALGTIKKTWSVIKMIVSYAEAKGDIPQGTLRLVKLPKESNVAVKSKDVPFINESDMNIIYEEAFRTIGANNRYIYGNASKLLVLIMYTGMRVSEACALKWSDVDLPNKSIRITSSLSKIKERSKDRQVLKNEDGTAKYKMITKSPKTGNSVREIPLPQRAIEMLEFFNAENPNHKPTDFVCLTKAGKPYEKRQVERCLTRMLSQSTCSRKDYTPHSLRHGYGSILISKGADIKLVSELLGHSDVTFTYNVYIGVFKEDKEKAIALLN